MPSPSPHHYTSARFRSSILLAAAFCLASLAAASAESLVSWGGDYATSTQHSNRTPEAAGGGGVDSFYQFGNVTGPAGIPVSLADALSPLKSKDYQGSSAVFYGGIAVARLGSGSTIDGGFGRVEVVDNGTADLISLETGSTSNNNQAFGGWVLWQKGDFLTGPNRAYALNPTSPAAITAMTAEVAQLSPGWVIRFVIRDAETTYVSASTFLSESGTFTLDAAALALESWIPVALGAGNFVMNGPGQEALTGGVEAGKLTDITAVGVAAFGEELSFKVPEKQVLQISGFDVSVDIKK